MKSECELCNTPMVRCEETGFWDHECKYERCGECGNIVHRDELLWSRELHKDLCQECMEEEREILKEFSEHEQAKHREESFNEDNGAA